MIWYPVIDFFKGRTGRVLVFSALFLVIFWLITRQHARTARERDGVQPKPAKSPEADWFSVTDLKEGFQPFLAPVSRPEAENVPPFEPLPQPDPEAPPAPLILKQHKADDTKPLAKSPQENSLMPKIELEEGDLLHCQLLARVRSDQRDAPVRARLTRPLIRHGRTVLPAGTNLIGHLGSSDNGRMRFENTWKVEVTKDNRIELNGQVQEAAIEPLKRQHLASDGSSGIPAKTIEPETKPNQSLKKIVGTFASAAARMAQDRTRTALGDEIPASARNVLLEGSSDLIEERTQLPSVANNSAIGPHYEIPAGTTFYIQILASDNVVE